MMGGDGSGGTAECYLEAHWGLRRAGQWEVGGKCRQGKQTVMVNQTQ